MKIKPQPSIYIPYFASIFVILDSLVTLSKSSVHLRKVQLLLISILFQLHLSPSLNRKRKLTTTTRGWYATWPRIWNRVLRIWPSLKTFVGKNWRTFCVITWPPFLTTQCEIFIVKGHSFNQNSDVIGTIS